MLFNIVLEHLYAEIREQNASSPSPPPLPPPPDHEMIESMNEERAMMESTYQAHVSIPSHLKWATPKSIKRVSNAAELAYLYERKDDEFELSFHSKQAGVTDVVDFLYEEPTSLSLIPTPRRSSYRKAMQQRNEEDSESEVGLSYPLRTQVETAML